jgi:serine/threonine-protein kinase HipA
MSTCRVCLEAAIGDAAYHPRCLKELFDTKKPPALDISTSSLHTAALSMVGHTSLPGVQKKISLGLSLDKATLAVASGRSQYILKPQTGVYPSLPENEHLTTHLAKLVGIETAPAGLLALTDGTLTFIIRRFDRLPNGQKVRQEDFCQLAQQPPKDKYSGSAEQCVRIVRQYASEPLIELMKLYRLLLFAWWTGNGDLHLKNLSLLVSEDDIIRLTPAYDLVSTHLVIPGDPLALPVGGKKTTLAADDWLRFADYCGLPHTVAERMFRKQEDITDEAAKLIGQSFLPADQQSEYETLIRERSSLLVAAI